MMYQLQNIGTRPMDSLLDELANIPRDFYCLIITDYENSNKTLDDLKILAEQIPQFITELDLTAIVLNSLILPHMEHFFSVLPQHIRKLYFNPENLTAASTKKFCHLLNTLTESDLYSLVLEGSGIAHRPQTDQIQILNSIARKITHLGLTKQAIDSTNFRRFAAALSQLTHLDSLDLSDNSFDDLTLDEFLEFLRAIPRNISSLSLSSNNLCHFVSEMDKICEALPPNLQKLDLTSNGFGATSGLPNLTRLTALRTLNFQGHGLELLHYSQINTFFTDKLNSTVSAVHLAGTVLNPQQFSPATYEQSGLVKVRALDLQMQRQYPPYNGTFWEVQQNPQLPEGSDEFDEQEHVPDSDTKENATSSLLKS